MKHKMEPSAAIYGLESQGRALCSPIGESETVRFFVGTLSTRSNGQIHQLDFDEETNRIKKTIYKPNIGEIWQLQFGPTSNDLIGIVYNDIVGRSAQLKGCIRKLPLKDDDGNEDLESILELASHGDFLEQQECHSLDWHPTREGIIASVLDNAFLIWNVETETPMLKRIDVSIPLVLYSGKWNPHLDGNQFSVICGTSIRTWDTRSMTEAWGLEAAHKYQVRDIDFNPNKQYYVATCGDDCSTRFWDYRKPTEPVKIFKTHSHWVWRVRYNTFHDQLVLTSGSDARVVLHSVPSISSEPKGHVVFSDSEDEPERQLTTPISDDGVLAKIEVHEDAVYAVEWSNSDAWTFASLSYDGRVVINKVAKSEKFKILL